MNKELEACPVCLSEVEYRDGWNYEEIYCEKCDIWFRQKSASRNIRKYWNKLPHKNKWLKYPENIPEGGGDTQILCAFINKNHILKNVFIYDTIRITSIDIMKKVVAFQYIDPYKEE